MSRQRFVQLVIAAVVALSIALLLNARRNETAATAGLPVFPGLAGELSSVSAVSLRKDSPTPGVMLHKTGNVWTVAERADYPADLSKLRKLLMSLGDAKIIEEKTADPQRFPSIGVEDPGISGAAGVEVSVSTPTAKRSLIVGKSVGGGNFVRKPDDTRSYSVEPGISIDADPRYWVDAHLLNVASSLIQAVDVKPAAGAPYVIRRPQPAEGSAKPDDSGINAAGANPAATNTSGSGATATAASPPVDNAYTLDRVPSGRKALESAALAPSPSMLSSLNADDVSPASSIDFGQSSQTTVTLTDGTVLTLIGTVVGDRHWIQVTSTKNAALSAKTAGRAFEIAGYRYDEIFKPIEQLLVPKEPPASKASATAKLPASSQPPASSKLRPHPPKGVGSSATLTNTP